jgi:ornithine decarboxylase
MSIIEHLHSVLPPRLVLRIATDDSKAVCRLSVKFGATLKTSRLLLERAKELNIDVIGVR